MNLTDVLIAGRWQPSEATGSFRAENPAQRMALDEHFPVSSWADCDAALNAASDARTEVESLEPARLAAFLETYADRIEARADEICETAHRETSLPIEPRLLNVELPRTTGQLRQAAAAARDGSWRQATIDAAANIRAYLAPIGPVAVFGPNNFPLAFNSVSGGDFAAAVAAGNPVIAKANSSHPGTTYLLGQEAQHAADQTGLPAGAVQLLYRTSHEDGKRLAADPRLGAIAYTGSRAAGLEIKASADAAGKPVYLELSSVNPVVLLPGALDEHSKSMLEELAGSCLLGVGQFCTCPNLIVMLACSSTEALVDQLAERFRAAPAGVLLSSGVLASLKESVARLEASGAEIVVGGNEIAADGYRFENTLLRVPADTFLKNASTLQTEAFGNAATVVIADDVSQAKEVVSQLEGSLTGSIYSAADGVDDQAYQQLAPLLRRRVGRLLNDKMPTGVAVSPAMNHGGPYPATGHPGFTAVGIPASLRRFAMLQCFDQVRPERLPPALRDQSPHGSMWRLIDGQWTQGDVPGSTNDT